MSKKVKVCLALFLSLAVIAQYSFTPQAMVAYGTEEGTVTAAEESGGDSGESSEQKASSSTQETTHATEAPAPTQAPAATTESTQATESTEATTVPEDQSDDVEDENDVNTGDPIAGEDQAVETEEEEAEDEEKYPAQDFSGSANGVSVSVSAPKGALPEGTKMSVSGVSSASVQAAVEGATGTDAAEIKAVDISFHHNGKEIEPKKAVKVHMNASGMANEGNQSVVHITDGGSASVITGNVSNGSASFSSNEFSIYIVVEDEQGELDHNAIVTYVFHAHGEVVSTQAVKNGDTLYNPGAVNTKTDGANKVFKGWYEEGSDTEVSFGVVKGITEEKTINVYARIVTTYYVTFYGEKINGARGIVAVKTVEVAEGETGSVRINDVPVTPKDATSAFKGWSATDGGNVINSDTITVDGRKDLYAVVVKAHWIHFDENDGGTGGGASYTGPVYVEENQNISDKKPSDPTRKGYTFGGWYRDQACTQPFNWTGTGADLDADITLYAKWNPADTSSFTVIIWKQKVTDAKNATNKTYDFEKSYVVSNVRTDSTITANMLREYTNRSYNGFTYNNYKIVDGNGNATTKVGAKGDTVVNVYYDRNTITFRFIVYGQLWETYTGLYGQTLAQNNYTWPSTYEWEDRDGVQVTFLDTFLENHDLIYEGRAGGWYTISHYKENVNGGYPSTPANATRVDGGTFHFSNKYDGFTIAGYRLGQGGAWHDVSAGDSVRYYNNLYVYYTRNTYELTFSDGDEALKTISEIPFEKQLTSYQNQAPTMPEKPGKTFVGWYEDKSGQVAFNWNSTMPAANKVVYAKYEDIKYQVDLDTNGGEFTGQQAEHFKVNYGTQLDKTSMSHIEKAGYEFVGWFLADGTAYSFDKVTSDVSLIARWRYPGQVAIEYNVGEPGAGATPVTDGYNYATNSSVVLAAPPDKIQDGYVFVGWQIEKDDSNTIYYPGNAFTINDKLIQGYSEETKTGTVKINAVYVNLAEGPEATTKIKYDPNGGVGTAYYAKIGDRVDLHINEKITADENTFTRTGYEFDSWNTSPDGTGLKVRAGQDVIAADLKTLSEKNNADNTLYAQWKGIEYTVVYTDGVDGEEVFADESHTGLKEGAATPKYNNGTDPTDRDEYAFDGWDPEVAATVSGNQATDKVITYTAKWKEKEIEISYVSADTTMGTVNPPSEKVGIVTGTITGSTATANSGYKFVNWTDAGGNVVSTNENYVPSNKVAATYTANFKSNTTGYVVHHYLKGTEINVAEDDHGAAVIGSKFTAKAATTFLHKFDGYNLKAGELKTITIDADPTKNVIDVYYTLPLTIAAKTDSKVFDRQPLNGAYSISGFLPKTFPDTAPKDDEAEIKEALGDAPSITNASVKSYLTAAEQSAITEKIPGYYDVSYTPGTLTIYKRSVTITSADAEKVYDGTALTNHNYTITGDGFLDGDMPTIIFTGTQTNVGSSLNYFSYSFPSVSGSALNAIVKAEGVEDNYDIKPVYGTLRVTPATEPTPPTPVPDDNGNNPGGGGNPAVAAVNPAPAAPAAAIDDTPAPTTINDEPAPRAATGFWALINLICAILTALLSLIMLIRYFGKRREEDEETGEVTEIKRKGGVKLASIIPAIGAIVAFILTEDMTLPMQMVDKWTVLMVVILAIQALVAFFSRKKEEEEDQEDEGAMA